MSARFLPPCGMGETPFTELWQPPTLASMSPSCAKANNSTSLLAFPRDTMGWDEGQASCHSDGLCVQSATGPAHTSQPGCLDWDRRQQCSRHSPLCPPIPTGPEHSGVWNTPPGWRGIHTVLEGSPSQSQQLFLALWEAGNVPLIISRPPAWDDDHRVPSSN